MKEEVGATCTRTNRGRQIQARGRARAAAAVQASKAKPAAKNVAAAADGDAPKGGLFGLGGSVLGGLARSYGTGWKF